MPGSKQSVDDNSFLITCLLHTNPLPKPDFAAVASRLGLKNADAAYKRHWSIMNKLKKSAGSIGAGAGADEDKTKKAPRKKVAKRQAEDEDGDGDGEEEKEKAMSKKVKHQKTDAESDGQVV